MSIFHPDNLSFRIAGGPELSERYDEQADILYLSIGEPRPAMSVTSKEGHLVRLDFETYEIVGFTLFDFCRRWQPPDSDGEFEFDITVTTPALGEPAGVKETTELHLVPA